MIIDYPGEYFSVKDTLECGQIFRFSPCRDGYTLVSADKVCFLKNEGDRVYIDCDDPDYFYAYFDLDRDYKEIYSEAVNYGIPFLTHAANKGKGIRILNQNREEMLFSFIISQNNNIPRIKKTIEAICASIGDKITFHGEEYSAFPSAETLASQSKEFFRSLGAGYRDEYLCDTAKRVALQGISHLDSLKGEALKCELMKYKGVGGKVADCVALFGFHDTSRFPVDTWLEKVYAEDFCGTEKSRKKMTAYFENLFGEKSGFIQQYLFHAKRNV